MTTLVNIRCPALALTISRSACGAQVTRPYAPAACRGCELGAAHARGEAPTTWGDGSAVEEVEVTAPGPVSERRVAFKPVHGYVQPHRHGHKVRAVRDVPAVKGKPRRVPGTGMPAATWWHDGREMTAHELAALPGVVVPASTIKNRLGAGTWSVERAIRQRVDESKRSAR